MERAEVERLYAVGREARLDGGESQDWIARLAPEQDGLRAAVEQLAADGDAERAVELAAAVWRLWLVSGDPEGGRGMLAAALDSGEPRPSLARALALYGDGLLAFRQGDQEGSRARNDAALAAARRIGDRGAEALALVGLSRVAFREGDNARVKELAREALALVEGDDDTSVAPLHMLAAGTRLAGGHDAARDLYLESLELNRRRGDSRMVAVELHNLGHVERHLGDLEAAARRFAECSELRQGSSDPYDAAMELLNSAALGGGDARELLGRAEALLAEAGIVLDPDDRFELDELGGRLAD